MAEPEQVGSGDALSPTTLVLNYLKKAGMQPTGENVRRALEANQRDSSLIPGLINDRPATDAEDRAAMAGSRGGGGSGRPLPTPPIPPTGGDPNTSAAPSGSGGDPTTSAAPGGTSTGDVAKVLALLGTGIGSAILGGRNLPGVGGVPQPGGSVPPMPDVGAGVPGIAPPAPAPAESSVLQGFRNNPVDAALTTATDGAPVISGVKPVAPGVVANAPPPGPTMPAELPPGVVPQMPATQGVRGTPIPAGRIPPRIPPRVPMRIPM